MAAASTTPDQRMAMVGHLKDRYGLRDPRVLAAMETVPRHLFIPEAHRDKLDPYGDHPCPIGEGQTISQPYILAYMINRLSVQPGERILEIGTGCGYGAAILAEMGLRVFSIERLPALADQARATLRSLGYDAISLRTGDGHEGWPEEAPFDMIIVACAAETVPERLCSQLGPEGRMIVPVGVGLQHLILVRQAEHGHRETRDLAVQFVPMVRDIPAKQAISE